MKDRLVIALNPHVSGPRVKINYHETPATNDAENLIRGEVVNPKNTRKKNLWKKYKYRKASG